MRFSLEDDGTLRSGQTGNSCLVGKHVPGDTSTGFNLLLDACSDTTPKWTYNASAKTLSTVAADGAALCLDDGVKGKTTATNVWARPLASGSYALVFINAGSEAADVTCGPDCFAAIGVAPGDRLAVRDLWAAEDLVDVTEATFTAKALDANGGHLMLKVTRYTQETLAMQV
jgi:hypothetical protein